ncbi:tRNA uridine-5-carboxymethylaminomethyl(34) synthesis GTPase MnmE [Simkania negevensis]|uniref:tRNA modification GTPase MnmE n=1 Tax=Simkania negevensis TaxID=83561 RepID=A0ABS3AQI7_9BACT|nr:tRNA uridine-5-carboxymethylaminomethyl(34) synthesis GTPase MnmE [Simkania negevensis]
MYYIHGSYEPGETVAAIATPPGEGGIAIVRIAGKEALSVAAKVFSRPVGKMASHTCRYGEICDSDGSVIDRGLALVLLGRRSFCGEDTVELHCHGGSLVSRRVLEAVVRAGARAAQPGEFAFKAFTNGKIDLAQAEAIQSLISAKNEMALTVADRQLAGALSDRVKGFQTRLTHLAAILEAWIDFPEEDLAFASFEQVVADLEAIESEINALVDTFHDGKILSEGLSLCLAGCPNVGKSSIMNALLEEDRAIVTHVPGTTRDVLENDLRLNGLNVKLIDTAGIRETEETIEVEGIRRSRLAMQRADLVLFVLDATQKIRAEEKALFKEVPGKKSIAIWNKIDLPYGDLPALPFEHVVSLSAKEGTGLAELKKKIDSVIWEGGVPSCEEVVITKLRHCEALQASSSAIRAVIDGLQQDVSPELLTLDMRSGLESLGKIIGTDITDDILADIFSHFCVGK